jgi:hypothetical protein
MEGKRFGAGIVGGLLTGLLVVGLASASAFTSGLFGSFSASPADPVGQSDRSAATTTVAHNETATNPLTNLLTTKSANSTTNTPAGPALVAYNSHLGNAQSSPSRLNNITAQPIALSGFVLLPVLVAFNLGAILFLTSRGLRRRKVSEEAADPAS